MQKLRDAVALGQLELAKAMDEVMPVEFVRRVLAHWAISSRNIIQGSDLTEAQAEAITSAVLAIDTEGFIHEMFKEMGIPDAVEGGQ